MSMAETLSAEKRDQILAGAAAVFASDGYEGASMAHIALEANVSKGTLYNYFPSKAALFSAYIAGECSRKLIHIFDDAVHTGDPAAELRDIGLSFLRMAMSPIACTIYRVVVSEVAKFPELARAFFDAGPARAIRHLAEWLAEETRRGRLHVPDPEFAAEQFFALCQTRLVMRQKLGMLTDPTPAEVERVIDASVEMFLRTYGKESSDAACLHR